MEENSFEKVDEAGRLLQQALREVKRVRPISIYLCHARYGMVW